MSKKVKLWCLLFVVLCVFVWSSVEPFDRWTWWMEVVPVMIAAPILCWTYKKSELTALLYSLIALHAVVLLLGGAYSYARVPFGFWLQDLFSLSRNPYDKIGHFMQGFVPALLAREVLIQKSWVGMSRVASGVAICFAMTVSVLYELIEWFAALMLGQGADEFLGAQGDIWDTQSDMFMALLGALAAVFLLGRLQDRQIKMLREVG